MSSAGHARSELSLWTEGKSRSEKWALMLIPSLHAKQTKLQYQHKMFSLVMVVKLRTTSTPWASCFVNCAMIPFCLETQYATSLLTLDSDMSPPGTLHMGFEEDPESDAAALHMAEEWINRRALKFGRGHSIDDMTVAQISLEDIQDKCVKVFALHAALPANMFCFYCVLSVALADA